MRTKLLHNRNVRLRFNRNARLRFLCFSARTCNSCWKAAAELKRPRCLASRSGLRFVELARCLDGGGWGGGGFGGLARLLQPLATFGTFECSLLRASIVLGDLVTLTSAVAEFFQCNRITNATCFECFFLCYSRIGPSMRPCAGTEDGDGDASASSFSQSEVHLKAHEEFGELRLGQQADVHSLRMFIADCDGVIKSTLCCRVSIFWAPAANAFSSCGCFSKTFYCTLKLSISFAPLRPALAMPAA